ncbi:MAG: hypothetical protein LAT84_06835 [Balneolia bacterium]|nr:hypothetical protein [Balneolia bacterium]
MNTFPFQLPDSLKSHLELFEKDPEKATGMLMRHLKRRGNDAVGYFLLGWFFLQQGKDEEARYCAAKAKAFAPGSPFFNYLPYYFKHPSRFEAWLPDDSRQMKPTGRDGSSSDSRFFINIDSLITKLSSPEAQRIKLKKASEHEVRHLPLKVGDGIATPTLARIYEDQQQYEQAIKAYEQIKRREPHRAEDCEAKIEQLSEYLTAQQQDKKPSKGKNKKRN